MGIFDFFKGNNSKLRVNENECEDVGIVTHYDGAPLTGVCYRFYENTEVLEMEIEMTEGLKNGEWKSYNDDGKLKSISFCKNDEIISRKYLDNDGTEIIVPNWFDGTLYENGDSIKFNNDSFMFSALELSIYDLLMGTYKITLSPDPKSHPQYDSLALYQKNCLEWFREANPRFHKEITSSTDIMGGLTAHLFGRLQKEDISNSSSESKPDKEIKELKLIDRKLDFKKWILSEVEENVGDESEYFHISYYVFLSEQDFLNDDDEFVFRGIELIIQANWWYDEESYDPNEPDEFDESYHLMFEISGKHKDSGKVHFIRNTPDGCAEGIDETEDLISGNIDEVSEYLNKLRTIDYNSLSSFCKDDFVEFD